MLHRVTVVGLGLIGGAVALAARKSRAATRVNGVADKAETIEKARALGAVDEATMNLAEGVQDSDLVILAVPVRMIPGVARAVLPHCRPDSVITDTGSSKAAVVQAVELLLAQSKSKAAFVGSHPIAGSEKTGIESAPEVNLRGAPCVITPTAQTGKDAVPRVDEFWKELGMRTFRMNPAEHDAVLARSSHLPHMLSYALANMQTERSFKISGPGLRDMTRLAGSEASLWTDIFEQNAPELAKLLREFGQEVLRQADEIEALSLTGTPGAEAARERIFRFLADAKTRHDEFYPPGGKAPAATNGDESEDGADGTEVVDGDLPPGGFREKDTQVLQK